MRARLNFRLGPVQITSGREPGTSRAPVWIALAVTVAVIALMVLAQN